jgi:hypothetical protein
LRQFKLQCKARFKLGVRANVQPKSSIPIGAKVEIGPKCFTLIGVKAELEKIFSICPKVLINAELYGLLLAPRLEKGYHRIWEANLQPFGANALAFISNLRGQTTIQKCSKLAWSFFGSDS